MSGRRFPGSSSGRSSDQSGSDQSGQTAKDSSRNSQLQAPQKDRLKPSVARPRRKSGIQVEKPEANTWAIKRVELKRERAVSLGARLENETRSILNKVAENNYDRLLVKIKGLVDQAVIDEKGDNLIFVVNQIFEMARDQHDRCDLYGRMCKDINEYRPARFRRLLLGCCQRFFEAGADADSVKEKQRVMGNVKFIGQLFKCRLLHEKIIHLCIGELIKTDVGNVPSANQIEAACTLLESVGEALDHPAGRKWMDRYFKYLPRLAGNHVKRIQFRVQDLHALRANKWVKA